MSLSAKSVSVEVESVGGVESSKLGNNATPHWQYPTPSHDMSGRAVETFRRKLGDGVSAIQPNVLAESIKECYNLIAKAS